MNRADARRGFTLIELLVVIGLIAILAGGIGVAMLGGNPDKALQNAQGTVGSLVSVARSRAAVTQANAALFVNTQAGTDGFLREFRVAVQSPGGWAVSGDPVFLDKGAYFVPPSAALPTTNVDFEPSTAAWNDLRSNAYGSTNITLRLPDDSANLSSDNYRMVELFNPRGGVVDFTPVRPDRRIVLSAARIESDGKIVFDRPDAVRGYFITRYGIGVLLNDDEALKP